MHAIELITLAAKIARGGREWIHCPQPWDHRPLNDYWCVSKIRLDRWFCQLKSCASGMEKGRPRGWSKARALVEEIIASEILTRVWAAAATARDRCGGTNDAEPLVRSILIGHMEARNRALRLLLCTPGVAADDAVALNNLRSQAERWTDLLIGGLLAESDVAEFAFEPDRARDFADDLRESHTADTETVWNTMLASLRHGFMQSLSTPAAQAELNAQIYQSVARSFGLSDADAYPLESLDWLQRIEQMTEATEDLIQQLEAEFTGRAAPTAPQGPMHFF